MKHEELIHLRGPEIPLGGKKAVQLKNRSVRLIGPSSKIGLLTSRKKAAKASTSRETIVLNNLRNSFELLSEAVRIKRLKERSR